MAADALAMIRAGMAMNGQTQAQSLARHAARLVAAHVEDSWRMARADPWRWRNPRLLWPLFTKD